MSRYLIVKKFEYSNERVHINSINERFIRNEYNNYEFIFRKSFLNSLIFIGFFLIYLFYFLSLEPCIEGIDKCCVKFIWIEKKVKEEIISCLLMAGMIQLMLFKIITKNHLIHIITIFIIFYSYSHGLYFYDHGYFNFLYFFILLVIITIILMPIDCCIKNCKNKNLNRKVIVIYFFIIISIYILFKTIGNNCDDWSKGLNNTYIENDESKYGCQIHIPKICVYKNFEYFQDYSKLIMKNCRNNLNGKKLKENLLKKSNSPYLNNATKRIGYPLLNKEQICYLDFPDYNNTLKKFFLDNLIDMDNEKILNEFGKEKIPEVEIDFTNIKEPKLIINVHYNNSLSIERKLLENNTEPFSNNILILYIDSVSRVNALRNLKKTTKFFEKFMPYKGGFNEYYPSENFHSFQFFKYHAFQGYTTVNFPFLFYGQNKTNNNKSLITKYFKENGYITSAANDWCVKDNTRTYHNYTTKDMYDHILPLCDPNNDNFNSNTIRCLYGKHNIEYLIEYTEQFWRKYKNNRKYSIIIDNHGHEGTLTVIKYIDDSLSNFLYKLYNDDLLKDTTVFLLSDHGVGMPSIYFSADFYKIEIHLPILLILINDQKNISYEKQYKYINENQQIFITPFDIYNTLGNIIYGNNYNEIENITQNKHSCKSPYGTSLFNKMNPKERYPMKYKYLGNYGISKYSCRQ